MAGTTDLGSYERLVWLYTFVPATLILAITILAFLPSIFYRSQSPSPYPYAPYFPFPLPEFIAAPDYSLALYISSPFPAISAAFSTIFTTITHTLLTTLFRQISIPLLLIPQHMVHRSPTWADPAFVRVWWLALGWAAAESVVAVKQGYESIALYRDVLVTVEKLHAVPASNSGFYGATENASFPLRTTDDTSSRAMGLWGDLGERESLISRRVAGTRKPFPSGLEDQVEHSIDQLLCLKNREELEEVYGMPFIRIPMFISCLQRINCLFLSLGFNLLLSSAYLRSTFGAPHLTPYHSAPPNERPLLLAALHTLPILPRIGVHTAVYVGLLVSLGTFFAGLGVWEALS
ncbi:hypothetical protein BD779DRAFT_1516823 [Infundibulicybe gibba]|nr:hypothetical protein BD779DRAFT_1516823 [Infundibulicybe gibba]